MGVDVQESRHGFSIGDRVRVRDTAKSKYRGLEGGVVGHENGVWPPGHKEQGLPLPGVKVLLDGQVKPKQLSYRSLELIEGNGVNGYGTGKNSQSNGSSEDSPSSFALERDLQRTLRRNIEQLETGLSIIDGGTERTVEAGRIDITAKDGEGNLVVIELKAGTAGMDSIGQILSYMGSIENPEGKHVRGILVAYDFDRRLVMAAKAVPNVSLKAYSVQFTFQDRG